MRAPRPTCSACNGVFLSSDDEATRSDPTRLRRHSGVNRNAPHLSLDLRDWPERPYPFGEGCCPSIQTVFLPTVLLPESFRGGCSFGPHLRFRKSGRLPQGAFDESDIRRGTSQVNRDRARRLRISLLESERT